MISIKFGVDIIIHYIVTFFLLMFCKLVTLNTFDVLILKTNDILHVTDEHPHQI